MSDDGGSWDHDTGGSGSSAPPCTKKQCIICGALGGIALVGWITISLIGGNSFKEYEKMTFTMDATLEFGRDEPLQEYVIQKDEPWTTDCQTLLSDIDEMAGVEKLDWFAIGDSNMQATSMNPLLYCLASSDKAPLVDSWWGYWFWDWQGLNGTLDEDVLDYMAERAVFAE